MTRIVTMISLAAFLGCTAASDLPGYHQKSGDMGAFILQHASKFGAHVQQTNGLPQLAGNWLFKEDAAGFQIYIVGNRFAQLESFLTAAFGSPAKPASANALAGTKSIGTYYGPALGAGLNYGWEMTRDGKEFTSMVVVSRAALKKGL